MKSKRQIKSEKLRKSLGKWKKQGKKPDIQEVVERKIVYRVPRKRDISNITKILRPFLVLTKRQGLQHPTIKVDIVTYWIMKNSYSKFMKKHNLNTSKVDELIILRLADKEPISAKSFLRKHLTFKHRA